MFSQKRKFRVLAMALLLTTVFAGTAQAGPLKWLSNKLGGDAVRSYYERTGHTCTDKPWYVPVPTHIWYNLTCSKTAR